MSVDTVLEVVASCVILYCKVAAYSSKRATQSAYVPGNPYDGALIMVCTQFVLLVECIVFLRYTFYLPDCLD